MARNGTGTYNLPAGNPVVTGSTISSTWANSTLNDMATALTGSIAKDGQTTPTGNLPMGGYAHTGVADATVRTMYGTAGQIQDSAFTYLTSPSGTDTMIATAALGMSAYVTGQRFFFLAPSTNTGACTLNINAIGAKAITKQGTTALIAGDIVSGAVIQVVYDGTEFQLVSPAGSAVNSFSAGTTGFTPSTASTGAITLGGTLAIANGGTNNGSLPVTAGGIVTTDGSKLANTGAGTSGQLLKSGGTGSATWASAKEDGSGNFSFNSGYGSSAPVYGCRAWVNFNGADGTIYASGNVTSVTRTGLGTYEVNLTNAMPDANYAVIGTYKGSNLNGVSSVVVQTTTTSKITFQTTTYNTQTDPTNVYISIFR